MDKEGKERTKNIISHIYCCTVEALQEAYIFVDVEQSGATKSGGAAKQATASGTDSNGRLQQMVHGFETKALNL